MKKLALVVLFLCVMALSFDLFADTLRLKNGTQLEGMVVEETDEYVIFDVYGGTVKFLRSEINDIVKGPLKAEPPKPAPAKKSAPHKGAVQTKKGGFQIPSLRLPEVQATGWKGDFLRRILKFVEHQSNPRALIQDFSVMKLLFWFLEALFVFLILALFIKLYIRLLGVSVPYGRACFFLFKFNIISNIIITVFSMAVAPSAGAQPHGAEAVASQWSQMIALPAAALLIIGVFFWLAGRDLESGFLKSIGLFVVMMFAYLFGGFVFSFFGLY